MTALLVFLKIIAYIISIPAFTFILGFITLYCYTLLISILKWKSLFYSLGYILGKHNLHIPDMSNVSPKNATEFNQGYNDGLA